MTKKRDKNKNRSKIYFLFHSSIHTTPFYASSTFAKLFYIFASPGESQFFSLSYSVPTSGICCIFFSSYNNTFINNFSFPKCTLVLVQMNASVFHNGWSRDLSIENESIYLYICIQLIPSYFSSLLVYSFYVSLRLLLVY